MRRILLIVVSVAVAAGACTSPQPTRFEALPEAISVIALGDSYTRGTSIDFTGSWPAQLERRLEGEGKFVDLTVVADAGWNTKRLHREFTNSWDGRTSDLIVVEIGVNDLVLNFGPENFLEGLDLLAADIEKIRTPTSVVVVLSLPDFRATPWGQERLERGYDFEGFNAILESFAARIGAQWVDITSTSAVALGEPTFVAPDDLHFSADMYALWVDAIVTALSQPEQVRDQAEVGRRSVEDRTRLS